MSKMAITRKEAKEFGPTILAAAQKKLHDATSEKILEQVMVLETHLKNLYSNMEKLSAEIAVYEERKAKISRGEFEISHDGTIVLIEAPPNETPIEPEISKDTNHDNVKATQYVKPSHES